MDDPIVLPTDVLAWHDRDWRNVIEYLRETGEIAEDEEIQSFDLHVEVDQHAEITQIETVKRNSQSE